MRQATTVFDAENKPVTVEAYPPNDKLAADIDNRFTYHTPKGDQVIRYGLLRDRAKQLAHLILALTPASREQSLALTHLEEAIFSANAAIARHE